MLKKIKIKSNPKGKEQSLEFNPGSVTLFVGPNNSGKSLILREIDQFCDSGLLSTFKILSNLEFDLDDAKVRAVVDSLLIETTESDRIQPGEIKFGKVNSVKGALESKLNPENLVTWMKDLQHMRHFCHHFVKMFVARFGGKERFNLVLDKSNGDLKSRPTSNLMALFMDDKKRKELRDLLFEAFNKYFVIDPTDMQKLRIRYSDEAPPSPDVERGWGEASVAFHKKAKHITDFSDGVQAFTGLVLSIVIGEEKIILLDEPEAFLHPSLSSMLGKKLADIMSTREGNLIVSTHSSSFVMGCIQSGKEINIVRLSYDGVNSSTARILPASKVLPLFRDPLLRSTGTIESIFFNYVIVTESDADRAFYNEINQRLLSNSDQRGIQNCLFLNAQNKQTIWRIIKPLREIGIPAVAIVDIDFIKEGGTNFSNALDSIFVPDALKPAFGTLRSNVKGYYDKSGKDMKRDGGRKILNGGELAAFDKLTTDFSEYGLFVVPNGELESWLKGLQPTGHGPSWLIPLFEKLGSDPSDTANYVQPSSGDVWDFFTGIKNWFKNNSRKGLD